MPASGNDRPSIRHLECLIAVADHKSFRRAAVALGISQPALSAAGPGRRGRSSALQVFERDRRSVLITPAGEEVVARARGWRSPRSTRSRCRTPARRAARRTAAARRDPDGGAVLVAGAAAARCARGSRALELILREDQTARLLAQLGDGQIDCRARRDPGAGRRHDRADRARDVRAGGAARRRRVRGDAASFASPTSRPQTVLLLEDGHCLRDQALAVCERGGAIESIEVRGTSLPTLEQMVAGGMGVTLLPEAAAATLARAARSGRDRRCSRSRARAGRSASRGARRAARLQEFRLLAEVMSEAAWQFLAKLRR